MISGMSLVAYGMLWKVFTERRLSDDLSFQAVEPTSNTVSAATHWSLFQNRDMWLVALSYAAYGYFQYLFFYWMNYYFNTILHVPQG